MNVVSRTGNPIYVFHERATIYRPAHWLAVIVADDTRYAGRTLAEAADAARNDYRMTNSTTHTNEGNQNTS